MKTSKAAKRKTIKKATGTVRPVAEKQPKETKALDQMRTAVEAGLEQGGATVEETPERGRKAKPAPDQSSRKHVKEPRVEREAVLDLEPERADDIRPVRAATHLGDVLELTARPEGATAVELDKAIVTTAKSVRHYGIWALRYALHKAKGFGFRTVVKQGEPARYHLVLPEGEELGSFLRHSATTEAKEHTARASGRLPKATKPSIEKASKSHGNPAAARA